MNGCLPPEPRRSSSGHSRPARLVKIGMGIVPYGRYVVLQLAQVAVQGALFPKILRRIDRLRPRPSPLPA